MDPESIHFRKGRMCVNHNVFGTRGRNTSYVRIAINQLYLRKNLVYYDVNITGPLGANLYVCVSPLTLFVV